MSLPKIAIITSISDDIETFKDPPIVHPLVDYIAFTGVKRDVVVWKQQALVKFTSFDKERNVLLPRIVPQLFCANHDIFILVKPDHILVEDPFSLVNKYLSDSMLGLFAHREYSCIWDIPWGTKSFNVLRQRDLYIKELGLPQQSGFYDLSVVIMRNTPTMLKMCLRWWEQICRYSAVSELSLPYVLWSLGIKPAVLPGHIPEQMSSSGDTIGILTMVSC